MAMIIFIRIKIFEELKHDLKLRWKSNYLRAPAVLCTTYLSIAEKGMSQNMINWGHISKQFFFQGMVSDVTAITAHKIASNYSKTSPWSTMLTVEKKTLKRGVEDG